MITVTKLKITKYLKTTCKDAQRGGNLAISATHAVKRDGEIVGYLERPHWARTLVYAWTAAGEPIGSAYNIQHARNFF